MSPAAFTTVPASPANLAISEIYYNPPGAAEDSEYLELRNISSTETIHLDGLRFDDGITFAFPDGLTLAPGETLLLVKDSAAFAATFGGGLPVAGEYGGSLSNGGEAISLSGIVAFTFGDAFPWPAAADGGGRSLVFTGGDPSLPTNWRASAVVGGSPGGSDATSFGGGDFARYAFGDFAPQVASPATASFPHNLAADDVTYVLESSNDMQNWGPAIGWTLVSESILGGTYSSSVSERTAPDADGFVRMAAEIP